MSGEVIESYSDSVCTTKLPEKLLSKCQVPPQTSCMRRGAVPRSEVAIAGLGDGEKWVLVNPLPVSSPDLL